MKRSFIALVGFLISSVARAQSLGLSEAGNFQILASHVLNIWCGVSGFFLVCCLIFCGIKFATGDKEAFHRLGKVIIGGVIVFGAGALFNLLDNLFLSSGVQTTNSLFQ